MSAGSATYAGAAPPPDGPTVFDRLRTRFKLRRCRQVGAGVRVLGPIWIHGSGALILGAHVLLDGRLAPIELHAAAGAVIELGDGVTVRGGTSIEAIDSIRVGAGSVLGPFVKVIDNNFHPLRGDRNRRPPSRKVTVEERVRIGERAILLPGAHVQAGAQIGAGSVISQRVPRGALARGNPARLADTRAAAP